MLRAGALVLSGLIAGPLAAAPGCDLSTLPTEGLVLRYDVAGDAVPRDRPLLEIDADGALRWRDRERMRAAQLSQEELAALWAQITVEAGFAAIEAEALPPVTPAGQGVTLGADGSLPLVVADAPVSYVQVTGARCSHAVAVRALAAAATVHAEDPQLQALRGIERELHALLGQLRG